MSFPDAFIQERSLLKIVFIDEAVELGCNLDEASALFQNLPLRIRETYTEKYKIGDPEWRYVYGERFNIGKGHGIGVPFQRPLVSSLIRASLIANKHLSKFEHNQWSKRLSNPAKHFGAISEMLVVTNVSANDRLIYEKKSSGIGNKAIDWLLEAKDGSFLLEVKIRPGQVAQRLEQEQAFERALSFPSEPIPNIEKLFAETTIKFKPTSESTNIQGAILFLSTKVPRVPFENHFWNHVQEKLHFVALVREDGLQVNLIAVSDEIKFRVLSAFGWVEDADFFIDPIE